jgi:integrase
MPFIPMLKVNNVRKGFLERSELDDILTRMPEHLRPAILFMFLTGWRKSEVLSLTTAQVDLVANVVRLEPGTTKNREARTIYVAGELRTILSEQLDSVDALKAGNIITPYVFHYADGKRIADFRGAWDAARTAAGYPTALLHDFRRSAVRSLERAGVPRSVAMARVGHKTESIYKRYAIVDEAMHREAAERLDAWSTEQRAKAQAEATRRGQVKRFARSSAN